MMHQGKLGPGLLIGLGLLVSACSPKLISHQMKVAPDQVPCPSDSRQPCWQVQIDDGEISYWPESQEIHGFDFEPGYQYLLAVSEQQPRRGAGPVIWRLDSILSQTAMNAPAARLSAQPWLLQAYGPNDDRQAPLEGAEVTLQFEVAQADPGKNGRAAGKAGCNRYFTSFELLEGDRLRFGAAGATRMLCMEPEGIMQLESRYLELLGKARSYHFQGQNLLILCERDQILLFSPAPNDATDE